MAQDVDRKLRVTAYMLGAVTRKDLAAAFRRINPATSFHVDRAHKWVQGRAQPREAQLYQDWATLLELARSGEWVANCDFNDFVEAVAAHHALDRDMLRIAGDGPVERPTRKPDDHGLSGTYVCYSHAWSPYFQGQIIRGALSITNEKEASELRITYSEALPTGYLHVTGTHALGRQALNFDLREPDGEAQLMFCLFSPTLPVRVLGGFMCGATIIGSDPGPSVTRIIIIRLPIDSAHVLDKPSPYLANGMSLVSDLESLGVITSSPQIAESHLVRFLNDRRSGLIDQPSAADFRALVEHFDREWATNFYLPASHASSPTPSAAAIPGADGNEDA